jgi:glutathione S-transferase
VAGEEAKAPWAIETIKKGLTTLEKALESSKGKYCVGDNVTMADIFLIPQLYNADRFGLPLDDFPKIASVKAELE